MHKAPIASEIIYFQNFFYLHIFLSILSAITLYDVQACSPSCPKFLAMFQMFHLSKENCTIHVKHVSLVREFLESIRALLTESVPISHSDMGSILLLMPFVVGGMFISLESHEFLQKVAKLSLLLSCYLKFRTCLTSETEPRSLTRPPF